MSDINIMQNMRVACIVPTYNGRADFARLLESLKRQTTQFDLFVVDSSSTDGTLQIAQSQVPDVTVIASADFNHGGTRQMMVEKYSGYDVYVFLTQDVCLEDNHAIAALIAPFCNETVGAVCARQLPHHDANLLAQHARFFNYPNVTLFKSLQDASKYGIKTPFISNSFSAYRGQALLEVGGFPSHVILSEDMYVASRMLKKGWAIVYEANSICRHSHNYTLKQEFCRYFDQGVFHSREPWIRTTFGGAGGEGGRYVKSELQFLGRKHIALWMPALIRNAAKLLAYKIGQKEKHLPIGLKRRISMHKRYWDQKDV